MSTPATGTRPRGSRLLDTELMRRLEQLALISKKVFRGRMKGERRSRKKGISIEFADYKDYVPGDDLRFIDWNAYGRLDRLFIKLFMEEEDLFVHVILDTSRSMGFGEPSKLELGSRVAAALGYICLCKLDRVALGAAAGGDALAMPSTRGRNQLWRLVTFLEALQADGSTDLSESVRRYFLKNRARGVAVVISDFLDPAGYEPALKQLLYHDLDIHLIHLLAAEELDPPISGDLRLVDVETGDSAEVTVNEEMLAAYRHTLAGFLGEVKRYAGDRGMQYTFASTSVRFEELVLENLRKGGLVR